MRESLAIVGMGGIDIEKLAGALSLANRQLVGVARSLLRPWRLLILDESTSAIDIEDRDRLFEALRNFRGQGRSILFVSHRMDEIDSLADRATVLRSGRSVATLERGFFSSEMLLELMSSRERSRAEKSARARQARGAGIEPLVTIRGLSVRKERPGFDFDLYRRRNCRRGRPRRARASGVSRMPRRSAPASGGRGARARRADQVGARCGSREDRLSASRSQNRGHSRATLDSRQRDSIGAERSRPMGSAAMGSP